MADLLSLVGGVLKPAGELVEDLATGNFNEVGSDLVQMAGSPVTQFGLNLIAPGSGQLASLASSVVKM